MRKIAFVTMCVLFAGACAEQPKSGAATPAQVQEVGVFADTGQGLIPLSAFGLRLSTIMPVKTTPISVPKVSKAAGFIVNLPEARGAELKLYWVPDLNLIFSGNLTALPATIEAGANGMTTLKTDALDERTSGYATLVVKMPAGSLDRFYAVQLGAAAPPRAGS